MPSTSRPGTEGRPTWRGAIRRARVSPREYLPALQARPRQAGSRNRTARTMSGSADPRARDRRTRSRCDVATPRSEASWAHPTTSATAGIARVATLTPPRRQPPPPRGVEPVSAGPKRGNSGRATAPRCRGWRTEARSRLLAKPEHSGVQPHLAESPAHRKHHSRDGRRVLRALGLPRASWTSTSARAGSPRRGRLERRSSSRSFRRVTAATEPGQPRAVYKPSTRTGRYTPE